MKYKKSIKQTKKEREIYDFFLENNEWKRKEIAEHFNVTGRTVYNIIGKYSEIDSAEDMGDMKDGEKYTVHNDTFKWNSRRGAMVKTIDEIDNMFYYFSKHGLNMTQDEVMEVFKLDVWQWNSIKHTFRLYKSSDVFSPYTWDNAEDKDKLLEERMNDKFSRGKLLTRKKYYKQANKELSKKLDFFREKEYIADVFYDYLSDFEVHARNKEYKITTQKSRMGGVRISIGDLHNGESSQDLRTELNKVVKRVNEMGAKYVELHIAGDLVESVSGLNHMDSFKFMHRDATGSALFTDTIDAMADFIGSIANVSKVTAVCGNHGRLSMSNKVDSLGEFEMMVYKTLDKYILKDIKFELDFLVIKNEFEGVGFLTSHGDKGLGKRMVNHPEKAIMEYYHDSELDYYVSETAHTHSGRVIQETGKLLALVIPSIINGGHFADTLGVSNRPGFMVYYRDSLGVFQYQKITI